MFNSNRGASSIEYALLLSIFGFACLSGASYTSSSLQGGFERIAFHLNQSAPRSGGSATGGGAPFQMMDGGASGSGPTLSYEGGQSATSNPNGALEFDDGISDVDRDVEGGSGSDPGK